MSTSAYAITQTAPVTYTTAQTALATQTQATPIAPASVTRAVDPNARIAALIAELAEALPNLNHPVEGYRVVFSKVNFNNLVDTRIYEKAGKVAIITVTSTTPIPDDIAICTSNEWGSSPAAPTIADSLGSVAGQFQKQFTVPCKPAMNNATLEYKLVKVMEVPATSTTPKAYNITAWEKGELNPATGLDENRKVNLAQFGHFAPKTTSIDTARFA